MSGSTLVTELPIGLQQFGYGCYMCVTPSGANESLFDTLNTPGSSWIDHYHKDKCMIKSIVPTVTDDEWNTGNVDDCDPGLDFLKAFRYSRNNTDIVLQPKIAGVYTLYPYIEVPSLTKPQLADDKTRTNWENRIATQLKYMLDPTYWITAEVIGLSKIAGGKVLKNFHGRILEENMADFKVDRYQYDAPITPSEQTPQLPSQCLISEVNLSAWFGPECKVPGQVGKENACVSDFETEVTYLNGTHRFYMSIEAGNGIQYGDNGNPNLDARWTGWAAIATSRSPILNAIIDETLTGSNVWYENLDYSKDNNDLISEFHTVMRQDGMEDCVARVGVVEVTVLYGSVYQTLAGAMSGYNQFRGNTKSKRFTSCNIDKDRIRFQTLDEDMQYIIQSAFDEFTYDTDFVCQNNEYQDNDYYSQPCFQYTSKELKIQNDWDWDCNWDKKPGEPPQTTYHQVRSSFTWDMLSSSIQYKIYDNNPYDQCYMYGSGYQFADNHRDNFVGFDVATGNAPNPYNKLTGDGDGKTVHCGDTQACYPGLGDWPGCWPKYNFAKLRRGYMGYPPAEGRAIKNYLYGTQNLDQDQTCTHPDQYDCNYCQTVGDTMLFKGSMLERVGIDGSDDEPLHLTKNNFRTISPPIPCRFEEPVRFFVRNDVTETGQRWGVWDPSDPKPGNAPLPAPSDFKPTQYDGGKSGTVCYDGWGDGPLPSHHLKGCSQSGDNQRQIVTISQTQLYRFIGEFHRFVTDEFTNIGHKLPDLCTYDGCNNKCTEPTYDQCLAKKQEPNVCLLFVHYILNTYPSVRLIDFRLPGASGQLTYGQDELNFIRYWLCEVELYDWTKKFYSLDNHQVTYPSQAACEKAGAPEDNVDCTGLVIIPSSNKAAQPLLACTADHVSSLAESVYFGTPSSKPKSNQEHYDGALISGWDPINVYGPIKSDGTPSATRVQAVVDEVNICECRVQCLRSMLVSDSQAPCQWA